MEMKESMTLCMSALYLTNETNEQRLRDVTVDNKKKIWKKVSRLVYLTMEPKTFQKSQNICTFSHR